MEESYKRELIARIVFGILCFLIVIIAAYLIYSMYDYVMGLEFTTGHVNDNLIIDTTPEDKLSNAKAVTEQTYQQGDSSEAPQSTDDEIIEQARNDVINDVSSALLAPQQHINVVPPTMKAWLNVDGVDIDDPVMQAKDNEYYLSHNELNEKDKWGCYYFSCNNAVSDINKMDRITVIFGHSNGNSTHYKFSTLKMFKDVDFASKNQYMYLTINGKTAKYKIFSACDYPINYSNIINVNPTDDYFKNEMLAMKKLSYNVYNTNLNYDDKILILCTCTGNHKYDTRYLVCGKRVE